LCQCSDKGRREVKIPVKSIYEIAVENKRGQGCVGSCQPPGMSTLRLATKDGLNPLGCAPQVWDTIKPVPVLPKIDP
jgi:hypothetical protein